MTATPSRAGRMRPPPFDPELAAALELLHEHIPPSILHAAVSQDARSARLRWLRRLLGA